jgi:hypothetical protein
MASDSEETFSPPVWEAVPDLTVESVEQAGVCEIGKSEHLVIGSSEGQ